MTGSELAERAVVQANKFGARPVRRHPVDGRDVRRRLLRCSHLDGGETVDGQVPARSPPAPTTAGSSVEGCERFEGCGVYYAATLNEAQLCRGADVVVVGGGNSAGQAAVFLASQARKVYLLIRGDDLYKNMSSYLARRIEQTAEHRGAAQHRRSTACSATATSTTSRDRQQQDRRDARRSKTPALFSFIGAVPRTDWLPDGDRDATPSGFVRTGPAVAKSPALGRAARSRSCWRPAGAACSPRATCAPARSSASPRPSAKARWRSSSSTST